MNQCICGVKSTSKVGTVSHYIKGKEISIHNIPHNYCNDCGRIFYNISEVKPVKYLKFANDNGLSDIDYNIKISV